MTDSENNILSLSVGDRVEFQEKQYQAVRVEANADFYSEPNEIKISITFHEVKKDV